MARTPIKRSSQEIDNWGFDETYNQPAVEILVENVAGTGLVRQKPISTEAKQDDIITALGSLVGLEIPAHNYVSLSYTGSNLTGVIYKTGGSGGTTVCTLTLGYDGSNNLTSVTKS